MDRRTSRTDPIGTLRRNPAFARVYAAQLVSFMGDWFAIVSLLGLVHDLTGSAAMQALVLTLETVPFALASPLAGVVADRFDRRAVMIGADIARASLALGFLLVDGREDVWIAFACLTGIGMMSAFFEPASSAALPNLVRAEDLASANVLMGSAWGTMLAVGAALGGLVTATLGHTAAFIGDATSFAVSALLLLSVRAPFQRARERPSHRMTPLRDVVELVRFARAERRVAALIIVKGGFGVGAGVLALIAVMAKDVFDAGDTGIGIIMAARGVGALIGPFLLARLFGDGDRSLFRAIAVAFIIFASGYALFGAAPALWVAALGAGIAHVGGGGQWTMSTIGLQRFAPDDIRGRIFSADYMLVTLTIGCSIAVGGVLAEAYPPRYVASGFAALQVGWGVAWVSLTRRWWPREGGA